MKVGAFAITMFFFGLFVAMTGAASGVRVSGELRTWHCVTLTFDGPETSEQATVNPFMDYRLDVTFECMGRRYVVPGYYAADGDAGQSGAEAGNKWRVHFVPDSTGEWRWTASFRKGTGVAVSDEAGAGEATGFDGATGSFTVQPTDKKAPDFRAKGMLRYVGEHYLRFAGTGEWFIKAGADSPENFLAYYEFDGTFDTQALNRQGEAQGELFIHKYEAHRRDWRPGDPTWRGGKGKNIIGALNYLSSKGMNSVYFITYNLDGGDGKDVWPWTGPQVRDRFDCSKLDQWEIVFSHMDRLGLMLHIITQEQENDQGLDGGDLGPIRKLYYRELIARFAHHLAITWNLGEENTNTAAQLKAFSTYIRKIDPYDHPIVVHTFPGQYAKVYEPMLGYADFEGTSLQMNQTGSNTHAETIKWLDRSAKAGRKWYVCLDEYGHGANGVKPDATHYTHDEPRKNCLWANLMAGGGGVEWYFGYKFPHNDLHCEDWRSRDHMWDLTRYAVEFFHAYLPFTEMKHADELTAAGDDFCFAKPGEVYAIYLPNGGTTTLDLGGASGAFTVQWFNPRTGGPLQQGDIRTVKGPGTVALGNPPKEADEDWVVLVRSEKREVP
ncbi:MAG TPA: DUF5060 domain-containing protein [Anaerohalosphaeraceae bacterium]|jgi:hypothetical protein|nr:DUF5060 domain-containing protein [Anaerohalosphaeraceae bacterium]HRT51271.1 DUF5060 domain-containing protein [Anaerohalosphaeraceae bacterium]HRT87762.1 DUF5060 domain-containing protein [Anaerohalosphaeraceae bacterium]